jgi:LysM repeat protein
MTRRFTIVFLVLVILLGLIVQPIHADGGSTYTVQAGDTMLVIAARYGIKVSQLARANGLNWNSWVYTGQRLIIPGQSTTSGGATGGGTYKVRKGDTLYSIARKHGVSVATLQTVNGLSNPNFIYTGQKLVIPGTVASYPSGGGERWIDVNLSTQTLTAYQGQTPVLQRSVSTGLWGTPTVAGTFKVYAKYPSVHMIGGWGAGYYNLPNVPHVMYFYKGYALHGTYWHNNFGAPMSHGCVNLSLADAKWLYNWASVGTKVVTHY